MMPESFKSIRNYKREYLMSDLMAGLIVAIISLPLSIALGLQSGSTLHVGIMTAIVAGFFISVMGGSRYQIGGPTAALAVLTLGYITDPQIGVTGLALITLEAGLLLIITGCLKAGSMVRYILYYLPYPLLVGFTTGIGITLLLNQVKDLLGLTLPDGAVSELLHNVTAYAQSMGTMNIWTLLVGAVTLALIYRLPRVNRKIPAAFCAIVAATVLTAGINALSGGIATIQSTYGDVQAEFRLIDFSGIGSVNMRRLTMPALFIALLCAMESLLSTTVADGMTNSTHDSNQELVGQGVANMASALLGGLPAAGAITRTAVSVKSGARTPLAGVFNALFLLVMYVALMPVVRFIPLAGLAAMLIAVAVRMVDLQLFVRLTTLGVRDSIVLIATCLLTVAFDLTHGMIGGMLLCALLNCPNMAHPVRIVGEQADGRSITLTLKGVMYFISVVRVLRYVKAHSDEYDRFDIDMAQVVSMDVTSAERLARLDKKLKQRGKSMRLLNAGRAIDARYKRFVSEILK